MNNEFNNNVNNELNIKSNNSSKIIIAILAILLIGALGYICYDKFIDNEKTPVPTPTPTASSEIVGVKEITVTKENQQVKVGNNTLNIKQCDGEFLEDALCINDKPKYKNGVENDYIAVQKMYVADNFIFFTGYGQFYEWINYAVDENGNEIKVKENDYSFNGAHFENGEIVTSGVDMIKTLNEEKEEFITLVIKYENDMVTIEPKK